MVRQIYSFDLNGLNRLNISIRPDGSQGSKFVSLKIVKDFMNILRGPPLTSKC